jgi:hypothetical protein
MAKQKKETAKPEPVSKLVDCVYCHYYTRCDVAEDGINKATLGCPRFKYSNS